MNSNKTIHNRQFIEDFCKGDNDAFANIFIEWQQEFFFYAYKYLQNESDAEDVLSDCVEKILKFSLTARTEKFIVQGVDLKLFLMIMIKNKSLDHLKVKKNRFRILNNVKHLFSTVTFNGVNTLHETEQVNHMLLPLSDREKTVIRLDLEGYSIEEISEKLGVTKKTVSNLLYESRKKLKVIWNL